MKHWILLTSLFLAGCERCGPGPNDYHGCVIACIPRGVRSVTFTRCECNPPLESAAPAASPDMLPGGAK